MDALPLELLQLIFENLDFKGQIDFKQVNTYLNSNCHITNLLDIDPIYLIKLSDEILQSFPHMDQLDA